MTQYYLDTTQILSCAREKNVSYFMIWISSYFIKTCSHFY